MQITHFQKAITSRFYENVKLGNLPYFQSAQLPFILDAIPQNNDFGHGGPKNHQLGPEMFLPSVVNHESDVITGTVHCELSAQDCDRL